MDTNPTVKGQLAYENKIIVLFFLTWGFLFIDRLAISFIFPVIVPDLGLSNAQVGTINMSFTIMWGVSAIVVSAFAGKKQGVTGGVTVAFMF